MTIFSPVNIGKLTVRNRIMYPPLVIFGLDTSDGAVGQQRIAHYRRLAENGVGTIVVEAAAIRSDCGLALCQVGIWDDKHIPELSELAKGINDNGAASFIQLQHCGGKTIPELSSDKIGPSSMEFNGSTMREATIYEISEIVRNFADAAYRAKLAGFSGVEIHAAHGYLLTQFHNPLINTRTDAYGGSTANRARITLEVLAAIKAKCGQDYPVGIRLGISEPDYAEGTAIAKLLDDAGIDYISASNGHSFSLDRAELGVPEDFPNNAITYCAAAVKKAVVSAPVIAVNQIKTIDNGEWLINSGHADMIAYGRSLFATPDMIPRYERGERENVCIYCKTCGWRGDFDDGCKGRELDKNRQD